jgi:pyrimidine-nucleoside phosphorylase
MNAKTLIERQRDGRELTRLELDFLVRGAVSGDIPDYQLTAWMMAVYFRGLSARGTADLTEAMLASGDRLPIAKSAYSAADKHSTGGVGDKISLLVAPLVAAAGVPVPMISGRSLGHTGGTLDKLESIPGYRSVLPPERFVRQVEEIGLCIAGQSDRLVPADRILYALRDAASIVESIPLITASILSKKAAAGVRGLALDVKFGEGAFMTDPARAEALAVSLVETAALLEIRARAHLTRMDFVLGETAGNALEIAETVRALRGERVAPVIRDLTLELGGSMLELVGAASSRAEGERRLLGLWESGSGYERFVRMVEAQGGDVASVAHPELLPRSSRVLDVAAPRDGWFVGIHARAAGDWITSAGGGRLKAGDPIDPRVGLEVLCPTGEHVRRGEPALRLHLPTEGESSGLAAAASTWVELAAEPPPPANPGFVTRTIEPMHRG